MNFMKSSRSIPAFLLMVIIVGITSFSQCIQAQTDTTKNQDMDHKALNIKGTITVGSRTFTITYRDNPTVRSLTEQMPFTVELEDYAGIEKIFYPDPALSTKNAPDGAEAAKGDVMYYAPWGDVAIFYKDFKYAKGLIPMAHIDNIDGFIEALPSTNTATFEIDN